ncbi:MAG: choice-of-anchor X domain-containing protein [Kiritimatiellia bacterium]
MKKVLGFCALLLLSAAAFATPPNTPTLDGRPIEYDATDLRGSFSGASSWGANGTLSNLFVTWDSNGVYVALQAWQASNNKLVVLLDVDPGAGTGATTTTNWTNVDPSFIQYNDYGWVGAGGFGLDYMMASEGTYNNCIRVNYDGEQPPTTNNVESLFDSGNGAVPAGTPIDMASVNDATACPHKGFEVRIPWADLYAGTRFGTVEPGEIVPRGATLNLLAGIHNNDPASAWSSPDSIPNQSVLDYTNGILTSADYVGVVVDVDANGIPDMLAGDVNAPYIRAATGAIGGSNVFVVFSEAVVSNTVVDPAHWTVGGAAPAAVQAQGPGGAMLELAAPIATNFLVVRADGVQDPSLNSRATEYCLVPATNGILQSVAVTFMVNTNSGMGISSSHPKPNAFFLNGDAFPLEWGFPPFETVPLAKSSNNWASITIVFPPGTPTAMKYKYSARISGTNTYEAIRLTDYADAARPLLLNTNGVPMTNVDYLGAAAAPLRNPADTNVPSAHNLLFEDVRRGDAGVRVRREILFQLDLSMRRRDRLARVMVMGSDPLRGFNSTGDNTGGTASDYPNNSAYLSWTNAGIQLVDDGTLGDATAGDGIYSRLWSFTPDGYDAAIETNSPYSLVGGAAAVWFPVTVPGTEPYLGDTYWTARRSPRSFIFKYYVLTDGGSPYESPSSNVEYYVADPDDASQIVIEPFVWDNESLPPPPPSNAPALTDVTVAGTAATVQFENVLTEGSHGVRICTNLLDAVVGFADYGLRATRISTNGGVAQWSAAVGQISAVKEYYAPYAGLEPDPLPTYWAPSFIPATATVWQLHYSQYKGDLKGKRAVAATGAFNGWGATPMTFLGDGHWVADIALADGTSGTAIEFKFRDGDTWLGGDNLKAMRGGPATWTPDQPTPDQLFAVALDVAGTPIAAATNVNIHLGYDSGWAEGSARPMTNTTGTVWQYAVVVPTNYSQSVNWVFNAQTNGSSATNWYSPADWKAFMTTLVNP